MKTPENETKFLSEPRPAQEEEAAVTEKYQRISHLFLSLTPTKTSAAKSHR